MNGNYEKRDLNFKESVDANISIFGTLDKPHDNDSFERCLIVKNVSLIVKLKNWDTKDEGDLEFPS